MLTQRLHAMGPESNAAAWGERQDLTLLTDVCPCAGVLQVEADQGSVGVVVQHRAVLHFVRLHGGAVRQMDVQRVGDWVLADLHGCQAACRYSTGKRPSFLASSSTISTMLPSSA